MGDYMEYPLLSSIVSEINIRSNRHVIGNLQEIRKDLKDLERLPTKSIFTSLTTFKLWAFHHGGRPELQFNVGIEKTELRHGIAFSLETSRTLPTIDVLIPKVKLFNEFMQLYPEIYSDMRMWTYKAGTQSLDYMPNVIPPELVTKGVFIFLGKRQPIERIDYELILNDFDRLLPLYKYVESNGKLQLISTVDVTPFGFRPGHTARPSSAVGSQAQKELDINLRHNILQEALFFHLVKEHGSDNVGTEIPSGAGTSIDIVVKKNDAFWFYEIKTSSSPRSCIRQAIGQLLEYAFWPELIEATRLIVVGESVLDKEGVRYITTLRERFSLPIEYMHFIKA
jgi:hypothetical protein